MSLLDDLDGCVEEEKQLADKKDESLSSMVRNISEEYKKFLEFHDDEFGITNNQYEQIVRKKIDFHITPKAIDVFLQEGYKYDDKNPIQIFTSMLFQNAYNQGHNDFNVPVLRDEEEIIIYWAYSYLHGTDVNPINITIKGDLTLMYCWGMRSANVRFTENTDEYSASHCKNSKIIFEADAGKFSANCSDNCDVYFYGNVGIGSGWNSKNICFYSPQIKYLEQISDEPGLRNCSFYLLDKNNDSEEVHFK